MGEDDGDVREIKGRCGDAEDGHDGLGAPDPDAVQDDAKQHDEPNSVDRSVGMSIDLTPKPTGSQS